MLKGEETTFKITESAFLRDLYTTLTFQCKVGLGIISLPKNVHSSYSAVF